MLHQQHQLWVPHQQPHNVVVVAAAEAEDLEVAVWVEEALGAIVVVLEDAEASEVGVAFRPLVVVPEGQDVGAL